MNKEFEMMPVSRPLESLQGVQRQDCAEHTVFYDCGNFRGCCPVDPCVFRHSEEPCIAAMNDGDDGDNDGGDEDITTTTDHTSSRTSQSSSTKDPKTSMTDDDSETSTSATKPTPSSASPSLPSSTQTSTTADDNTFATGISTSDSPTGTLPAPTSWPLDESESEKAPLSKTAVAGVSIGGAVGGIALLVLLFWLLRRRQLSKRMSSVRGGGSPKPLPTPDEKYAADEQQQQQRQSLISTALGPRTRDPFAEFGGRAQDPDIDYAARPRHISTKHTRPDEGWPLCAAPNEHDISPLTDRAVATPPTRLDGRPACAELDSTETMTGRPGPSGARRSSSLPLDAQIHPPQLTPGFPSLHMAAQNHRRNSGVSQGQSQRQGQRRDERESEGENRHNLAGTPRDVPRATLNATDDERKNNRYANSWAHGP